MITKFKIYSNNDLNIEMENNDENLNKKIIDNFSLIIYKQKRKPKNLRVKKLKGYYNKRDFKNFNLIYKTKIIIELSNFDIIEGKLVVYLDSIKNNIKIKINNTLVYNINNKKFDNETLIEKLKEKYKNYIQKKFNIK